MKNKLPDYIIEELIPRFRGIDTPTIAHVECKFLNMNRNFIMSKTSKPDYDELHFDIDGGMFSTYDITLCSDKMYREIKNSYEHVGQYDEIDGMLTTKCYSITTGMTYVTSVGFMNHFKIRTLVDEFTIDIKKNYKFDSSKLKVNDVFIITINYKIRSSAVRYGILLSVNDTTLELKLATGFVQDDDNTPMKYEINIDEIISGKVTLERVDL
jgi:hypothetical protein